MGRFEWVWALCASAACSCEIDKITEAHNNWRGTRKKQTNKQKKKENYAKILLIIGQNKLDVLFKLQKFWLHFPFVLRYLSAFLICLSQETALDVHKIIYSTNLLIYIFFFFSRSLCKVRSLSEVFDSKRRLSKREKKLAIKNSFVSSSWMSRGANVRISCLGPNEFWAATVTRKTEMFQNSLRTFNWSNVFGWLDSNSVIWLFNFVPPLYI